ncbi:acetyltransferase [Alcaligenes sp. 13f]|uniref:GNAT family N-acetyltransferase n=1 Tax=Alcaligenes sp. 13f TaxID=2841924 RepID=UPI001CF68B00|nr:GNAT family N-acetyltransferase [Alcaligenes sp. 13f]MCB4320895.1 acetyltransferase [Alcaligenes sp. 13f]
MNKLKASGNVFRTDFRQEDTKLNETLSIIEEAFFAPSYPDEITIDSASALCLEDILHMEAIKGSASETIGSPFFCVKREDFLQCGRAWLSRALSNPRVDDYVQSGALRHPQRPERPIGFVYSRYISQLGYRLSFRGLDPEVDQIHLHTWMNNERVNAFWGMQGTPEFHYQLLHALLADKHAQPLIGEFDGCPFGYFDVYWAKEDKVGQHYDAADYDRGLHMLVGDDRFRGEHRVEAWLASLIHYAFLDESRTQRLVCEPRIDNERMINYLRRFGFSVVGEIDFPHKKALLLSMTRDIFFKRGMLLGSLD